MDFSKLGNAAAESDDMSVNKSFERELPKEGVAFLRLIGYIETGRHEARNKTHKPALKTQLIFELSHPKHLIEMDGKKVPQKFTLRLNKGMTSKSGYKKVFNMMNKALGGGHTHFFQMFDKPLLGDIFHNTVGEGDDKKIYANLDNEGAYSFRSNVKEDELSGEMVTIPIPERHNDMIGFLWENETTSDEDYKAMWDSLYIEGEREVEDPKNKGEKIMKSKNWIQEIIMENLEWEGSTCQALTQEHLSIDELDTLGTEPVNLAAAAEGGDIVTM